MTTLSQTPIANAPTLSWPKSLHDHRPDIGDGLLHYTGIIGLGTIRPQFKAENKIARDFVHPAESKDLTGAD